MGVTVAAVQARIDKHDLSTDEDEARRDRADERTNGRPLDGVAQSQPANSQLNASSNFKQHVNYKLVCCDVSRPCLKFDSVTVAAYSLTFDFAAA